MEGKVTGKLPYSSVWGKLISTTIWTLADINLIGQATVPSDYLQHATYHNDHHHHHPWSSSSIHQHHGVDLWCPKNTILREAPLPAKSAVQMDFSYSPTLLNRPESAFLRPINTSNSQEKIKGPLQHWFGFCYESCTQLFHGMMVPAQWWLSIAKLLGPCAKLKFSELLILANFLINPSWYTARVLYICHNKPPIIQHVSVQRMLRTSYCSTHPTAQAEYTSFSIIQC